MPTRASSAMSISSCCGAPCAARATSARARTIVSGTFGARSSRGACAMRPCACPTSTFSPCRAHRVFLAAVLVVRRAVAAVVMAAAAKQTLEEEAEEEAEKEGEAEEEGEAEGEEAEQVVARALIGCLHAGEPTSPRLEQIQVQIRAPVLRAVEASKRTASFESVSTLVTGVEEISC